MKTFTITAGANTLDIAILRHVRVDGSRFPTPDPDAIADYFVIGARLNGNIVDFYPNEGADKDTLAFGFVGKKVIAVYELVSGSDETGDAVYAPTGTTKRGGDFRRRFFRLIARRLGKAILARQLGKRVKDLTRADEAATNGLLNRLLTGNFTPPADLTVYDIDNAARFLRDADGALEEGEKPPGTVANIDCDFDAQALATGSEFETGAVRVGASTGFRRGIFRFPLSAITAGSTINDTDFQFNITTNNGVDSGDNFDFNQYGTSDPDTDSAATKYTNAGGTAYASATDMHTTGSHTYDLGATADTDVGNQLASPGWLTVGIEPTTGFGATENILIEAEDQALGDPATLTVDYTAPAAGTVPLMAMMGVGT